MQMKWFSHLSDKVEQDEFKKIVIGSQKVLDRLHEICYNIVQNREVPNVADYNNPSWAYKQADTNGYIRAYQEIAKLCEVSDHED